MIDRVGSGHSPHLEERPHGSPAWKPEGAELPAQPVRARGLRGAKIAPTDSDPCGLVICDWGREQALLRELEAAMRSLVAGSSSADLSLLLPPREESSRRSPGGDSLTALQRTASCIAALDPEVVALTVCPQELAITGDVIERAEGAAGQTLELIRELSAQDRLVVAVVGRELEEEQLRDLLEAGASDFLVSPLRGAEVRLRLRRLLTQERRQDPEMGRLKERVALRRLVGRSEAFRRVVEMIPVIAQCDAGVLIRGETGTGKEVVARAVHYLSPRAQRPFVPVNCGALPVELMESELFGHERAAFTGATQARGGLVREAEGGTLFLDEVDSLSPAAQVKLLRFLQEREYRPVGSTKTQRADVRVLAAANGELERAVEEGRLREDLFYRLNVIPLELPPLRERGEDVRLLAEHFLQRYAEDLDKRLETLAPAAVMALQAHSWPGNVRELQHVMQRVAVLSPGPVIHRRDLGFALPQRGHGHRSTPGSMADFAAASPAFLEGESALQMEEAGEVQPLRSAKAKVVESFERAYLERLLTLFGGNISQAARAAQKNRRALFELIRKYGIAVDKYRTSA
ncbi:MAG: sigma-54 dependent transcriptional regulator [Acidobacteriota bacterium]